MFELLMSVLIMIMVNVFIMIGCDLIFDFECRNATPNILIVGNAAIATILLAMVIYADVGFQVVVAK